MYTAFYGPWNFGDTTWGPAAGPNPVLFVAMSKSAGNGFFDFVRICPESIEDYNLVPSLATTIAAMPVSTNTPEGMNFTPGGIGYAKDPGSRIFVYIKYHGGQLPPWAPDTCKDDPQVQAAVKQSKAATVAVTPKPVLPPAPKPSGFFGWMGLFTSWLKK
jgi:hypothetical protein